MSINFFQAVFCRYAELILKKKIHYGSDILPWHYPNGNEVGKYLMLKTTRAGILDKLTVLGPDGIELPPRLSKKDQWLRQRERLLSKGKILILRDKDLFITKDNFDEIIGTKPLMIDAFFFDHRYFYAIKDRIPEEFSFRLPLDKRNAKLAEKIKNCCSVSVHIRQGDYKNSKTLNICGPEYYRKAIEQIYAKLSDPVFFVFSEDPSSSAAFRHPPVFRFFITDL